MSNCSITSSCPTITCDICCLMDAYAFCSRSIDCWLSAAKEVSDMIGSCLPRTWNDGHRTRRCLILPNPKGVGENKMEKDSGEPFTQSCSQALPGNPARRDHRGSAPNSDELRGAALTAGGVCPALRSRAEPESLGTRGLASVAWLAADTSASNDARS